MSLIVKRAKRGDTGAYRLNLRNNAGFDNVTFNVRVSIYCLFIWSAVIVMCSNEKITQQSSKSHPNRKKTITSDGRPVIVTTAWLSDFVGVLGSVELAVPSARGFMSASFIGNRCPIARAMWSLSLIHI